MAANTKVDVTVIMDKNLKTELHRSLSNPEPHLADRSVMPAEKDVREQAIPSETAMEVPNAETRQAMQDTLEGKELSREYSSFGEMMSDIDADG